MITFQKIRWKNFLSTGNQFTEVDFQENATNLIVGTNGTGKSTVLDALTFGLFNKPFRKINKSQLLNSTNEKDCLVEVEFCINNKEYLVRRGIKPNIFVIIVDGNALHKEADDRVMQKMLEENILKVNYKSFTQIVILGSSTFVPFMQLPVASRREVVEDLLDIKIFSSMNDLIKSKIRAIREDVRTLDLKKDAIKDKVEMQKSFIDKLDKEGNDTIKSKEESIESLQQEVRDGFMSGTELEDQLLKKQEELKVFEGASKRLREYGSIKGKMSQRINTLVKDHKFFTDNRVCPICNQDIEEEFRVNRIRDSQDKAAELQQGYKELQQAIKDEELRESSFTQLTGEVTKLLNGITQNNTHISGCQKQVNRLESEIQTITNQIANRNSEQSRLNELRDSLEETYSDLATRKEDIAYHDFIYSLLKDGGVKSKIIKKYLPLINQQVNKYLQLMDFYINFKLDEEFSETVESPIHEDFSYASFSEGEKMRIDLSLLFTWREIARVKNSVNTNLLIMDEVFDSSLDGFGTDEFLKIIRYIISDANIFVISHKTGMEDKFEEVLKFEKVKGFSRKC